MGGRGRPERGGLFGAFDWGIENGFTKQGDAVIDFAAFRLVGMEELDGIEQVAEEEVKVVAGDAESFMDGVEGAAGVGAGWGTESGGEEFELHLAEFIHGEMEEEGSEGGIGENAFVEAIDEQGDADIAADAIEESGRRVAHDVNPREIYHFPAWTG
jgi:hypothetical protein